MGITLRFTHSPVLPSGQQTTERQTPSLPIPLLHGPFRGATNLESTALHSILISWWWDDTSTKDSLGATGQLEEGAHWLVGVNIRMETVNISTVNKSHRIRNLSPLCCSCFGWFAANAHAIYKRTKHTYEYPLQALADECKKENCEFIVDNTEFVADGPTPLVE